MKYLVAWAFVGLIVWCYYDLNQRGVPFITPTFHIGGSR